MIASMVHGMGAMSGMDRVKLLKLVWDAVGSEFASRHLRYDSFYAGAQFVTRGHSFRTYDWAAAGAMAQGLMRRSNAPEVAGEA
jgi:4-hydroxyphenylacetate 3-monooxygenase